LSANDPGKALRQAADYYKVDVDAITAKVKQEFAAKEKAKVGRKPVAKTPPKGVKKSAAA
jgi:ParB family chromosome partitioning protein